MDVPIPPAGADPQERAQALIGRRDRLKAARRPFEAHWQEIAEVLRPSRADFTADRAAGAPRNERIFDSTPMQAARGLAAAIDAMLKPKTRSWFRVRAADAVLERRQDVRAWLEDAEERMHRAIYDHRARFTERSGEVDLDLVTFGTGVLFVGEKVGEGRFSFRSHHLRDTLVALDEEGVADSAFVTLRLTARQAAQRFGADRLGEAAREALADRPDERFSYLHAVVPNDAWEPGRPDRRGLPFAYFVVDEAEGRILGEGGFHEFPFLVPFWDTAAGEEYGRGPGTLALPDIQTLHEVTRTLLKAGQKSVDPPLLVQDDAVLNAARLWPGGINYYDGSALGNSMRRPIEPIPLGANIPLGDAMLREKREQVWAAFFRNVLQLPVDSPAMTATEVIERREEFVRVIGPTFGRLESSYVGPLVERCFAIMMRAGAFPRAPAVLEGADIRFEYENPVMAARRQIEVAAGVRTLELMAPMAGIDPGVMDHLDLDAMARDVARFTGMPARWLRPEGVVAQKRRAAQAEAASAGDVLSAVLGGMAPGIAP